MNIAPAASHGRPFWLHDVRPGQVFRFVGAPEEGTFMVQHPHHSAAFNGGVRYVELESGICFETDDTLEMNREVIIYFDADLQLGSGAVYHD